MNNPHMRNLYIFATALMADIRTAHARNNVVFINHDTYTKFDEALQAAFYHENNPTDCCNNSVTTPDLTMLKKLHHAMTVLRELRQPRFINLLVDAVTEHTVALGEMLTRAPAPIMHFATGEKEAFNVKTADRRYWWGIDPAAREQDRVVFDTQHIGRARRFMGHSPVPSPEEFKEPIAPPPGARSPQLNELDRFDDLIRNALYVDVSKIDARMNTPPRLWTLGRIQLKVSAYNNFLEWRDKWIKPEDRKHCSDNLVYKMRKMRKVPNTWLYHFDRHAYTFVREDFTS